MLRRKVAGAVVAALVLVSLVACGGSEATASPSAEGESTAPAVTSAPASTAPSASPAVTTSTGKVRMLATCGGVAVRTGPAPGEDLLVRVVKLTKVRVVETVQGEAYEAGACGSSGSDWIKIDRINGTSVKKLYGVPYGYAAAGFFQ